ncbi:DUF1244 domain-containing protein [Alphaproteobacteria bacterium]|nr:DUF1244 domain-containing protein [Alphaproteobacteria bacterium]
MKQRIISNDQKLNIQSKVFEKLILHLQKRTDVQNIDLMNLSGFCRNCISKWYSEAAREEGLEIDYENSREKIYGMSYQDWKDKYQKQI